MHTCSCENMNRMIREMEERREEVPERVRLCYDLLVAAQDGEGSPCCMTVMLLYYAFFCENTHSVSEEARHVLIPLIEGRMVGDEEEREWVESGRRKR